MIHTVEVDVTDQVEELAAEMAAEMIEVDGLHRAKHDAARYHVAVAYLQDIQRGLMTCDEALRDLGEQRP